MYTTNTSVSDIAEVDAGLRSYLLKVYNLMSLGLVFSAFMAYLVVNTSLSQYFFTVDTAGRVHTTGLMLICMLVPILLVFVMGSDQGRKWSDSTMYMIYALFTGCLGIGASGVLMDTNIDVIHPFLATIAAFSGLSIVGYTTKRDLSPVGSFCMMGLWGMIGLGLIGLITGFHISSMITGLVGVGIFAGLTAYDTQRIKTGYLETRDSSTRAALWDALSLYLDAYNMFMSMLRMFNARN